MSEWVQQYCYKVGVNDIYMSLAKQLKFELHALTITDGLTHIAVRYIGV